MAYSSPSANSGITPDNIGMTSQQANSAIGDITAPITQGQQAALFVMPGQAAINNNIANLQNTYANQTAPQLFSSPLAGLTSLGGVANAGSTNINTGTSNAITAGQIANINALNATAQGQGPSVAAIQAQQTGQQNVANEMAMLGSQRGSSNPALGLRSAQNAIATANQQAVQAATLGRAQEELNAQNQLQQALGTTQGQVQQGAQSQATLGQATNIANQAAANNATLTQGAMAQQTSLANQTAQQQTNIANLGQQGATQQLNTSEANAALAAQMSQANNIAALNSNYAGLVTNENTQQAGLANKLAVNTQNNNLGLMGSGIGGVAALGGVAASASDRNLKTNIKPGIKSMKDFLSTISNNNSILQFNLME